MKNIEATICLNDEKVCYTAGDEVGGVVTLDLPSDFDVRNINVSLCCDEISMIRPMTGVVGDARSLVEQTCHYKCTSELFPGRPLESIERREALGKTYFKVSRGKHEFGFQFRIPADSNLPGSVQIGDAAGYARILWYVKVSLRRKDIVGDQVRDLVLRIIMIPTREVPLLEKPEYRSLKCLLSMRAPGITWMARRLFPSEQKKHNLPVIIVSGISQQGAFQYPHTIGLQVRMEAPDSFNLIIKECVLYLDEHMKITILDGGGGAEITKRHLICRNSCEHGFESGICDVSDEFITATLSGYVETFKTKHLHHFYELLVKLVVCNKANPLESGSIYQCIPVHVWGDLSTLPHSSDRNNCDLPRYQR